MSLKSVSVAAILIISASVGHAGAQGTDFHDGSTYPKYMKHGRQIVLGYMYDLYGDCRSAGDFKVNVTSRPQGGIVTFVQTRDFPTYPSSDEKYKCDNHKTNVTKVFYKSDKTFVGRDSFGLQIVPPVGSPLIFNMQIDVQ